MKQAKYSPKFSGSPELSEEDKRAYAAMSEEQLESALQAHTNMIKLLQERLDRLKRHKQCKQPAD